MTIGPAISWEKKLQMQNNLTNFTFYSFDKHQLRMQSVKSNETNANGNGKLKFRKFSFNKNIIINKKIYILNSNKNILINIVKIKYTSLKPNKNILEKKIK